MPKHLFIFSDGTWNSPEMETQTNVFNLATLISHTCPAGYPQLVFYDPGIGTEGSTISKVLDAATGNGIDLNIQQLYTFLAMNYEEGDLIYLFGFSRGAYTVRSLCGMIHEAGLCYRSNLGDVKEAYDLYRTNRDPDSETAREFRKKCSRRVPIKLLACFDTVGALGLPVDSIPLGRFFLNQDKYKFHDTTVCANVEHAIHILGIDEDRKGFVPTLMEPHPERGPDQVTQVFMPGRHTGVGGGDKAEKVFSDNALRFLVTEMERRGLSIGLQKELVPEEKEPTIPPAKVDFQYKMLKFLAGQQIRNIESIDLLHQSAYRRYSKVREWRPPALEKFKDLETFGINLRSFGEGNGR